MYGGETYDPSLDGPRLDSQLGAVRKLMGNGEWWTLPQLCLEVSAITGKYCSEAGISARVRDLRKARFGNHTVATQRGKGGSWRYQLVREVSS